MIHQVIIWPRPQMFAQGQKSTMFARTIVVIPTGGLIGFHQIIAGRYVAGPLRATAKIIIGFTQVF